MRPPLAQKYTASCGLACLAYLINSSEEHLLEENSDILSIEKLNFIGLF